MLKVSESALNELKKFVGKENSEGMGIRIFASGGGCCGPAFALDVARGQENDIQIEQNGLNIYIDPAIADILDNVTIDFVNEGGENFFKLIGLQQKGCC
jgi:iron-sulfur cluster assembly accessory protein